MPRVPPAKSFEALYERHLKDVYGYALALLESPADAEDATQATFLNAYRALERGERPRNATSWLRKIALNVCREHFRRGSRRPQEVSLDNDPGLLVDDSSTPEIGDVIRALSHLSFNQRAALVMRELEGLSLAEIAGRLRVSTPAVESLLFRARRALREQLEESLRCDQAEEAISRQLDGVLPRAERGPLRAHLRECRECASLARRLRAQRTAIKSLGLVPVPAGLLWSKVAGVGGGGPSTATLGGAASGGVPVASGLTAGVAPVAVKLAGAALLAVVALGGGIAALGSHGSRAGASAVPQGHRVVSRGASGVGTVASAIVGGKRFASALTGGRSHYRTRRSGNGDAGSQHARSQSAANDQALLAARPGTNSARTVAGSPGGSGASNRHAVGKGRGNGNSGGTGRSGGRQHPRGKGNGHGNGGGKTPPGKAKPQPTTPAPAPGRGRTHG